MKQTCPEWHTDLQHATPLLNERKLCQKAPGKDVRYHNFVSGLHNSLKFSQPLKCLYQAMQTQEKRFLLLL